MILDLIAIVGFKSWDLDATCVISSAPLPKGQKLFLKSIEDIPGSSKRQGTQAVKNYLWAHTSTIRFLSVVIQKLHKSRIHSIEI